MEYYAKSENSQGHQETGKEHLQKVAALAREYREALGLADAAKLWAHVHDFGKYTKASQDVLKGTRTGVDHAISSACFLECCYKGSPGSCPVIQPYLPRCHRRVPPQLCPRFHVLRRGDPCVHTAPRAAFPGDELLRADVQPVRQLCQRAARAERRRLFGTCLDLDALAAHRRERDKAAVFQRNLSGRPAGMAGMDAACRDGSPLCKIIRVVDGRAGRAARPNANLTARVPAQHRPVCHQHGLHAVPCRRDRRADARRAAADHRQLCSHRLHDTTCTSIAHTFCSSDFVRYIQIMTSKIVRFYYQISFFLRYFLSLCLS